MWKILLIVNMNTTNLFFVIKEINELIEKKTSWYGQKQIRILNEGDLIYDTYVLLFKGLFFEILDQWASVLCQRSSLSIPGRSLAWFTQLKMSEAILSREVIPRRYISSLH